MVEDSEMMSLDEFLEEARNDLDRFHKFWMRGHSENPEGYPMEIEAGLWTEQILQFWSMGMGEDIEPTADTPEKTSRP